MHHSLSPMPKTHPVRTCLLKWYAMEGEFGSEEEIYTLQVLHPAYYPACFAWFYWCLPVTRRRECCWSLEPHAHHSVVRPTWGRCDSLGDLKKFMYNVYAMHVYVCIYAYIMLSCCDIRSCMHSCFLVTLKPRGIWSKSPRAAVRQGHFVALQLQQGYLKNWPNSRRNPDGHGAKQPPPFSQECSWYTVGNSSATSALLVRLVDDWKLIPYGTSKLGRQPYPSKTWLLKFKAGEYLCNLTNK